MKVIYFHQHYTNPQGTVGIRSYAMSRALADQGHQVSIVCGSYKGGDTGLRQPFKNGIRRGIVSNNIEVIELELSYENSDSFRQRSLIFFKYVFRSMKLIFSENYDIVIATSTPLTVGIPGIFARWLRRKPFVFEVRDLWPQLPKAMGVISNPIIINFLSAIEWASYHSAHHIIALSPGIAKGILEKGVPTDKISMIPNGCDIDIFSPDVSAWRPPEIKDTDFIAIFAGTHGIANGLDSVLDAALELQSRGRNDIKFLLIGNGGLKKHLIKRAHDEGLLNMIFMDPINKKSLSGLMAASDVGLQILKNLPAFYYGTSPNKFFDYISAGLPVINNYPGWLSDMIEHNNCGFTVKPNNPIEFADALASAADNHSSLKIKGKNARNLAITEFDRKMLASDWVKKIVAVYSAEKRK